MNLNEDEAQTGFPQAVPAQTQPSATQPVTQPSVRGPRFLSVAVQPSSPVPPQRPRLVVRPGQAQPVQVHPERSGAQAAKAIEATTLATPAPVGPPPSHPLPSLVQVQPVVSVDRPIAASLSVPPLVAAQVQNDAPAMVPDSPPTEVPPPAPSPSPAPVQVQVQEPPAIRPQTQVFDTASFQPSNGKERSIVSPFPATQVSFLSAQPRRENLTDRRRRRHPEAFADEPGPIPETTPVSQAVKELPLWVEHEEHDGDGDFFEDYGESESSARPSSMGSDDWSRQSLHPAFPPDRPPHAARTAPANQNRPSAPHPGDPQRHAEPVPDFDHEARQRVHPDDMDLAFLPPPRFTDDRPVYSQASYDVHDGHDPGWSPSVYRTTASNTGNPAAFYRPVAPGSAPTSSRRRFAPSSHQATVPTGKSPSLLRPVTPYRAAFDSTASSRFSASPNGHKPFRSAYHDGYLGSRKIGEARWAPSGKSSQTSPEGHDKSEDSLYVESLFLNAHPSAEHALEPFYFLTDAEFYAKDFAGRYIAVNDAMLRNCCTEDPRDVLGRTDDELPAPAPTSVSESEDRLVLHGTPVINRPWFAFTTSGSLRWLVINKRPVMESNNRTVGLYCVTRQLTTFSSQEARLKNYAAAFRAIGSHLERTSITELAALTGTRPGQIDRDFVRIFGMPCRQFLLSFRLAKARHLLLHSDASVSEIGRITGFPWRRDFMREFERLNKVSPYAYRERFFRISTSV